MATCYRTKIQITLSSNSFPRQEQGPRFQGSEAADNQHPPPFGATIHPLDEAVCPSMDSAVPFERHVVDPRGRNVVGGDSDGLPKQENPTIQEGYPPTKKGRPVAAIVHDSMSMAWLVSCRSPLLRLYRIRTSSGFERVTVGKNPNRSKIGTLLSPSG